MPLSVSEVAALVISPVRPGETERLPLRDALDRVLGDDVVSPVALPPWDNASMDGYAVRRMDIEGASGNRPVVLPVRGTIAAGHHAGQSHEQGTAIRIMTGAPVPAGADTVIRVEDTDGGLDRVAVRDARDAGRNVRPRGEDIAFGRVVVARGTVLGPPQIGVLASVGAGEVYVYRRPRVALLATGDEVVDLDHFHEVLAGRRIVSSNSYSLRAAIHRAGADVVDLGICPDDRDELADRMRHGLDCDLLVTSGGVSVGAFDHTRQVVRSLGGTVLVDRVRMRPGAPFGFGVIGTTPWLGLPGNPVSALVTFELFGRPILRRMRGERLLFPITVPAVVDEEILLHGSLTHFLRAVVEGGMDGSLHARLTGGQGSGMLTSVSGGNALLAIPADRTTVGVGEMVQAIILGNHTLMSTAFSLGE